MRDAGPEGTQVGGAGRNRHLARRSKITATTLALAALRIALAIILDTVALVVWDIGTRPPVRLIADVRAGLRDRFAVARGAARLAIGSVAILAAITVSAPVANRPFDATVIECWALVTALVLEQLLGPDLRSRGRD